MFINISYYRFGKIFLNEEGITTMVENYGLLGYPLTHTMSPPIHYALFDLYGRRVDYQVFELPPEQLDHHIPELFGLLGFNITIPHKVGIIPYLDRLDETAKRYNSVNLVKCEKEKVGYNTDVIGFTKSIEQLGASLNSRVLLLGCGGVGDRHIDIFWGLWTLNFNLGTDRYSDIFLDAYGRDTVDKETLLAVSCAEALI